MMNEINIREEASKNVIIHPRILFISSKVLIFRCSNLPRLVGCPEKKKDGGSRKFGISVNTFLLETRNKQEVTLKLPQSTM